MRAVRTGAVEIKMGKAVSLMPDREKVMKGLECHLSSDDCRSCVYWDGVKSGRPCEVMEDALALLKYQEESLRFYAEKCDELYAVAKSRTEVVRCKDCKHWSAERINDFNKCRRWINVGVRNFATMGDWYCADGERAKDSQD